MQLVIGNKNYSSWSMRPWVALRHFGIPFEERRLSFVPWDSFAQQIRALSPAGRVPVLIDGGLVVWDTLAIIEYAAERFPQHALWPIDAAARARARSLCAEMHAGFGQLRQHCPMNLEASLPDVGARLMAEQDGVRSDLERIGAMWTDALNASGGPYLFGAFSAADAFFAPVCARIRTYALPIGIQLAAYVDRVFADAAVAQWVHEAMAEHEWVPEDEPYRTRPA